MGTVAALEGRTLAPNMVLTGTVEPDGSLGPGTDFCEVAGDGRMRLITVWPGSDDFPVPYPRKH